MLKSIAIPYTFRDRMAEWALASGMLIWGLMCLIMDVIFNNSHYYSSLVVLMPQIAWGVLAVSVGFIRLLFLLINGLYKRSSHIRAIGCFFGCLVWASLVIGSIGLFPIVSPNLPIFLTLFILDSFSLWFAAGDAKLVDLLTKGE